MFDYFYFVLALCSVPIMNKSSLCTRLDSARKDRARLASGKLLFPLSPSVLGGNDVPSTAVAAIVPCLDG